MNNNKAANELWEQKSKSVELFFQILFDDN